MELKKISVVLHMPSDLPYNITDFEQMLDSIKKSKLCFVPGHIGW